MPNGGRSQALTWEGVLDRDTHDDARGIRGWLPLSDRHCPLVPVLAVQFGAALYRGVGNSDQRRRVIVGTAHQAQASAPGGARAASALAS